MKYILKYIIKFFQSRDNNEKKNSAFIISRNTCKKIANQCSTEFNDEIVLVRINKLAKARFIFPQVAESKFPTEKKMKHEACMNFS